MNKIEVTQKYFQACRNGDLDKVKYFLTSEELDERADINHASSNGLIAACANGHLDVVKYLLKSPDLKEHADVHTDAFSYHGFRYACVMGHTDVIRYLIEETELCSLSNIGSFSIPPYAKIGEADIAGMINVRALEDQLKKEMALCAYPETEPRKRAVRI